MLLRACAVSVEMIGDYKDGGDNPAKAKTVPCSKI